MGLLDPELDAARLAAFVSKESAWPLYERCNRNDAIGLLNDKQVFHAACGSAGLPTLGCERVLHPEDLRDLRRKAQAGALTGPPDWIASLPELFVVKPVQGYHGDGVEFFRRDGDQLHLLSGEHLAFEDVLSRLVSISGAETVGAHESGRGQRVMFQRMGMAHPELARLSGRTVMQSVRICTYLDANGNADLLFAFLKVIAGDSMIDNFQGGKTGNIIADLDQDTGKVLRAIHFDPALGASRPIERHPITGEALVGFQLPQWSEARELAIRAAKVFHGTRAVGWDIGVTDQGPVLLEGNGTWDPVAPLYRALPTP